MGLGCLKFKGVKLSPIFYSAMDENQKFAIQIEILM
jgi:hypothetical protein